MARPKDGWLKFQEGVEAVLQASGRAQAASGEAQAAWAGAAANGGLPASGPYARQAPPHPPGVSLEANMREAGRHPVELLWFLNKVRTGQEWDYKDPKRGGAEYADFGNYNFGATGTAAGIPAPVLRAGAGLNQQWRDLIGANQNQT